MIVFENVSKDFGRGKVLDGISFRIAPNECVCMLGPGGSGKSVLLSLLIGAVIPTGGRITVDGADLRAIPRPALQLFRRKIGVVFQDGKLLGNRTVSENIAFPLEACGASDAIVERRVNELLRRLRLEKLRDALPNELSSGEQALTAIARAISHTPLILIADEPMRNLDPQDAENALRLFRERHSVGMTMILMTRDVALAETLRARVIRLDHGKIVNERRPETQREYVVQTPKELVKAHVEAIEKKRKVRVTAIHSEG